MNTFDTALPVTITAGDEAFGSELLVSVEIQPAEPDVGVISEGYVVMSVLLEVTAEFLVALGHHNEEDFRFAVNSRGYAFIGFSLEDITIDKGMMPLESKLLEQEINEYLAGERAVLEKTA